MRPHPVTASARFPAHAAILVVLAIAVAGCGVRPLRAPNDPASPPPRATPDRAVEDRILALNPERVTAADVRDTLAKGPAPRIMLIHGGIYPVHLSMTSFGEFLVGMGYPESSIRDPYDGSWSHSPYEDAERLAGIAAWYYERDGMPPMIIGHSQGGMQAVKVLHVLDGTYSPRVPVWNPLTDFAENRTAIVDPLTGRPQEVVGLRLSYVSVGGGGRRGVPAAQPVEPARQAAHDPRHGRRFHRLLDRRRLLGVDGARRRRHAQVHERRPRERAQRDAAGRIQPRRGAGDARPARRTPRCAPGSTRMPRARCRRRRPRTPATSCGRPTSGTA